MKIAVCIPTNGPPTWQLFDSFGRWQAYHYHEHPDIGVDIIRPPRPLPVDVARSYLAHEFLKTECDWLWFIDQDAAFLPQTLDRLMAWDVDIVGAACLMREAEFCRPMAFTDFNEDRQAWNIPVDPMFNYYKDNGAVETNKPQIVDPVPDDSLLSVTFTGCHCLLIRREVLEKMPAPHFRGAPGTEDRYFCLKAAELGYAINVDLSTFVGHATGSRILGIHDFMSHTLLKMHLEGAYDEKDRESRDD